jgi:hypothetical protein
MRHLLACLTIVGVVFLGYPEVHGIAANQDKTTLHALGYYVALRATLNHEQLVDVFGATNLPPGSVLQVSIINYIGQGGHPVSVHALAKVPEAGVFRIELRAKKGLKFQRNMVCDVVFSPADPNQPGHVLDVVGRAGEALGDPQRNPQLTGTPRVQVLDATTVVQ